MLLPILFVHGDKGQHIYRCLEEKKKCAFSGPVKAVFRYAVFCISLEGALASYATHISMVWDTILIESYEHSIVVLSRLVDHLLVGEGIYHVTIESSL